MLPRKTQLQVARKGEWSSTRLLDKRIHFLLVFMECGSLAPAFFGHSQSEDSKVAARLRRFRTVHFLSLSSRTRSPDGTR
jgi:hypothetical protein